MLVRIILFILIIKYHKQIYKFLINNNLLSIQGIKDKIETSCAKVSKTINTNEISKQLAKLKLLDKGAYGEVKKRLHNIDTIYLTIKNNKDISLKNDYQNIKLEKKRILNRISNIVISKGFHGQSQSILVSIEKYIDNILQNILDERDMRGINTEWFEGTLYDIAEPFDNSTNYNYDFY